MPCFMLEIIDKDLMSTECVQDIQESVNYLDPHGIGIYKNTGKVRKLILIEQENIF